MMASADEEAVEHCTTISSFWAADKERVLATDGDRASFVGSTRVPESRADLLEFRVTPAPGSARQFVRTRYTVLQ